MSERFYFPGPLDQNSVELIGTEAHHLLNVLRMKEGDEVDIFNGEGNSARAVIQSFTKRSAILEIISHHNDEESNHNKIVIASAVPKGDRFRWMIEKLTELNVAEYIPLTTTRSVVDPGKGKLDKMEKTMISACKQSGRNRLMKIHPQISLSEIFDNQDSSSLKLIAHPGGDSIKNVFKENPLNEEKQSTLLVIGPEGGFTDEEINIADLKGFQTISLGDCILRIETAAISASAIVQNFRD